MKIVGFVFFSLIANSLFAQQIQLNQHTFTKEQPYLELEFEGKPPKKGYKKIVAVSNLGEPDLIIQQLEGGCDCIKVRLKKKRIRRNQTTSLVIKWNPPVDTEFSGSINIKSNDPNYPEVWIQLLGHIEN